MPYLLHVCPRHVLADSTAVSPREDERSSAQPSETEAGDRGLVRPPGEDVTSLPGPEGNLPVIVAQHEPLPVLAPGQAGHGGVEVLPGHLDLLGRLVSLQPPEVAAPVRGCRQQNISGRAPAANIHVGVVALQHGQSVNLNLLWWRGGRGCNIWGSPQHQAASNYTFLRRPVGSLGNIVVVVVSCVWFATVGDILLLHN